MNFRSGLITVNFFGNKDYHQCLNSVLIREQIWFFVEINVFYKIGGSL